MQEFQPPPPAADQAKLRKFYQQRPGEDEVTFEQRMHQDAADLERKGFTLVRRVPKIGRNDPCPCNSGRKFKKCCIHRAE